MNVLSGTFLRLPRLEKKPNQVIPLHRAMPQCCARVMMNFSMSKYLRLLRLEEDKSGDTVIWALSRKIHP